MAAPVVSAAEVAMAVPAGARRAWALLAPVVRPVWAAASAMPVTVVAALTVMRELPMAAEVAMAARVAARVEAEMAVPAAVAGPQTPQAWPAEMAEQVATAVRTQRESRVRVARVAQVVPDSAVQLAP